MDEKSEFTLPSGATIMVTPAGFAVVKELHDCVMRSFLTAGGKVEDITSPDVIFKAILSAGCSKEVEAAIFKCAETAVYSPDGTEAKRMKVDKVLFDTPAVQEQARGDYYGIIMQVVAVNLRPFFQALFSVLKTFIPVTPAAGTPEQK
jgi:hypothetical protein